MSHVTTGHEITVVTNRGNAVFLFRSAIYRGIFTKRVIVSDDDLRRAASIGDVLRFSAYNHAWEQMIVAANCDMTGERDSIIQYGTLTNLYVWTHNAKGTNGNVVCNARGGVYLSQFRYVLCHSCGFCGLGTLGQCVTQFVLAENLAHQLCVEPMSCAIRLKIAI